MKTLGSLKGSGILRRGGASVGQVDYDLTVVDTGRSRGATGWLRGDVGMLIDPVMASEEHELQLATGEVMRVVVSQASNERARAESTGPIPGF